MRPRGVTLVELLAVTVLIGIAASLVALRLGGGSDAARLEQAAQMISARMRHAQSLARTSGLPRLVTVDDGAITIHKPVATNGEINWDEGSRHALPRDVGAAAQRSEGDKLAIRIDSAGRFARLALTLRVRDRAVDLTLDPVFGVTVVVPRVSGDDA